MAFPVSVAEFFRCSKPSKKFPRESFEKFRLEFPPLSPA
jgi:hypothetical protein